MKTLQRFGGFAALYLAVAYLIGIALFLVVLDYPSMTDPAQKVALLVEKQMVIFSTNLLMYVFFGVFLIVLSLALYDRLHSGAPAIMQVATAIGIIWAGSLIASGMVSNAGIAPVVALYAKDPAQAALTWQGIESVASGMGNGNGEILGGLLTLLVSLAALRAGGLPKGLNILSLLVGAVGIISIFPGLTDLTGVFGLSQVIWFVGLGIVLLPESRAGQSARSHPMSPAADGFAAR
jgi:type IV secretory pathway TrbD component